MRLRTHFISALIVTGVANAAGAATIEIGSATGRRGAEVEISVVLRTEGDQVAGTENQIVFPADLEPLECRVNLAIDRTASMFNKATPECRRASCNYIKTLIFDFADLSPLDDGVTLYSCRVRIAPDADVGDHLLECAEPGAATPDGTAVDTLCRNGDVHVTDAPAVPTRVTIPTPTWIPSPTQMPFPTPTHRYPPPEEEYFFFLETNLIEVSAERGGMVVILGGVLDTYADRFLDTHLGRARIIDIRFKRSPEVGIDIDFDQEADSLHYWFDDSRVVDVGAALVIRPGSTYVGEVVITAEAGPRRASTSFWIVPGDEEQSVRSVVVSTESDSIEGRPGGRVPVVAQVFASDGEAVNGVPVLFRSEVGFFEPTVAMAEFDGQRDGVARATLSIGEDTEARVDPTTGSILPYTVTARSGSVTGYSEVFVLPSRQVNDGGAAGAPLNGPSANDDGCAVSPANRRPGLAWLTVLLLPWLGLVRDTALRRRSCEVSFRGASRFTSQARRCGPSNRCRVSS